MDVASSEDLPDAAHSNSKKIMDTNKTPRKVTVLFALGSRRLLRVKTDDS